MSLQPVDLSSALETPRGAQARVGDSRRSVAPAIANPLSGTATLFGDALLLPLLGLLIESVDIDTALHQSLDRTGAPQGSLGWRAHIAAGPSGSPSGRHRGSVEELPTILAGAFRRVHR